MGRRSSIIGLLSVLLVVPLVALLAGGSKQAVDSILALRAANGIVAVAQTDRGLLQGLIALRALGGQVQTALLAEADPKPKIAAARAQIDSQVRPAQLRLAALGLPEATQIELELGVTVAQVDQSFALLDAEAAKPVSARRLEAVEPNLKASHAAGAAFERASGAIGGRLRMAGTELAELMELRIEAWAMRSAYGLQCSLLRPLVARGSRMDAKASQELGRLRGATGAAAERLGTLAADPGAPPDIANQAIAAIAAVAGANRGIGQIVERLDDGGKPVESAEQWTKNCNVPFEPSIKVVTMVLDAEVTAALASQTVSVRNLGLAGAIVGGAVLLAATTWWLVRRRLAEPLKQLANQTARATAEIARHIGAVRAATDASVAAVTRIDRKIGEISAIAGSIAAAIEQQGTTTAGIARNVAETAAAANEIKDRTSAVSDEAEHTGRQAAEVLDNATALRVSISELSQSVIRAVRTATPEVDSSARTFRAAS